MRTTLAFLAYALLCLITAGGTFAQSLPLAAATGPVVQEPPRDYQLAAGDTIHIVVFQNPDLTLDTRVSEKGTITYPLIGTVAIGGLTIAAAEARLAKALEDGNFVKGPQVNIGLTQIIGNQVAVLGYVNRPGSYPLLTFETHLTQMLATAGGITQLGSQKVILSGNRDGQHFSREIDIGAIYLEGKVQDDVVLSAGDSVFVPKAPMFYIYGEVNHPGEYPLERNMTVMQALAAGGGPTVRGSENRLKLSRRGPDGVVHKYSPEMFDAVQPDDVIYVNESFF